MKFLKTASFGVLFLALLLTACNKETEQIVPTQGNNLTKDNVVLNDVSSTTPNEAGDIVGRYIHNGVEIPFESIDLNDENVEMYYNFGSSDESTILVFYNSAEVEEWISTLNDEQANVITKRRSFTTSARQIANATNIEEYYAQNGTTSTEYDEAMELLRIRIYGSNNGGSRGLGFLFDETNFTGNTAPIIGIGIGKPIIFGLDEQAGSLKVFSLSATYAFFPKMFYRGTVLNVNCLFPAASSFGNSSINVGNAAGFSGLFSYVTFVQGGALAGWNNTTRSFIPSFF